YSSFRRTLLYIIHVLTTQENLPFCLSTLITTDLDRIADYIIFIHEGEIVFQKSMEEIREQFHIVKGKNELLDSDIRSLFIGIQETAANFTALYEGNTSLFQDFNDEIIIERAALEDVMYFMAKGA